MSIELPVTTRHRRDLTDNVENDVKLKPEQTHKQLLCTDIPENLLSGRLRVGIRLAFYVSCAENYVYMAGKNARVKYQVITPSQATCWTGFKP